MQNVVKSFRNLIPPEKDWIKRLIPMSFDEYCLSNDAQTMNKNKKTVSLKHIRVCHQISKLKTFLRFSQTIRPYHNIVYCHVDIQTYYMYAYIIHHEKLEYFMLPLFQLASNVAYQHPECAQIITHSKLQWLVLQVLYGTILQPILYELSLFDKYLYLSKS